MTTLILLFIISGVLTLILVQKIRVRLVIKEGVRVEFDYSLLTVSLKKEKKKKRREKKRPAPVLPIIRAIQYAIPKSEVEIGELSLSLANSAPPPAIDITLALSLFNFLSSVTIFLWEYLKRKRTKNERE